MIANKITMEFKEEEEEKQSEEKGIKESYVSLLFILKEKQMS